MTAVGKIQPNSGMLDILIAAAFRLDSTSEEHTCATSNLHITKN